MFRTLCKEIETEFIGAKLDSEEKTREWQRKINNIKLWACFAKYHKYKLHFSKVSFYGLMVDLQI